MIYIVLVAGLLEWIQQRPWSTGYSLFNRRIWNVNKTPILWPPDATSWLIGKDPDAGKDWGQEENGMTGWDGWMTSPTQWTWVRVDSRSWWWTGRPGVLQFMGLQWVGHDWVTELELVSLWEQRLGGGDWCDVCELHMPVRHQTNTEMEFRVENRLTD